MKARLDRLVIPEMVTTLEAGKLLENLGMLWRNAELPERYQVLAGIMHAVYLGIVKARKVVAVSPKPLGYLELDRQERREAITKYG